MGEDEKRFPICATEDELQWALGHIDLRNLLAGWRVDKNLAVGNVNVAVAVDRYTFASTVRKDLEIGKRAIGIHLGVVGDVFRLAADIDALARLGGEETVGVEVVAEAPA